MEDRGIWIRSVRVETSMMAENTKRGVSEGQNKENPSVEVYRSDLTRL